MYYVKAIPGVCGAIEQTAVRLCTATPDERLAERLERVHREEDERRALERPTSPREVLGDRPDPDPRAVVKRVSRRPRS